MFSIKTNFEKRIPLIGSLKPSSSICNVLFSSEEKYLGSLLLFYFSFSLGHSPSQLSRIEIESEYSNCFSINLLVVQNLSLNPLQKQRENAKKYRYFVNKGTLLRYSLSITDYNSPLNFHRFLQVFIDHVAQ